MFIATVGGVCLIKGYKYVGWDSHQSTGSRFKVKHQSISIFTIRKRRTSDSELSYFRLFEAVSSGSNLGICLLSKKSICNDKKHNQNQYANGLTVILQSLSFLVEQHLEGLFCTLHFDDALFGSLYLSLSIVMNSDMTYRGPWIEISLVLNSGVFTWILREDTNIHKT